MDSFPYLPLLECPDCASTLAAKKDKITCAKCSVDYPLVDGIPWIFSYPHMILQEWKNQFQHYLQSLNAELLAIQGELKNVSSELTRSRLQNLEKAKKKHIVTIAETLKPLALAGQEQNLSLLGALKTKLPFRQNLLSYYSNLHRDWSWGDAENKATFAAVEKAIGKNKSLGKCAVLGSGGSRLAYDLHQAFAPEFTVCTDINPLLLLVAKQVVQGKEFPLYEFPVVPVDLKSHAVLQNLRAPKPVNENFYFLFGDALNPPFQAGSLDTILTPWLIDIIPQKPTEYARRMNRVLAKGGRWLNVGALAFSFSEWEPNLSKEELVEALENSGFKVTSVSQEAMPYMQSPHSAHGRVEKVLCFSAEKESDVEVPERYEYLPDWITDTAKPVPASENLQSVIPAHQIPMNILSHVDGKKSIDEIALKALVIPFKMDKPTAARSLQNFFTTLFEQKIFR